MVKVRFYGKYINEDVVSRSTAAGRKHLFFIVDVYLSLSFCCLSSVLAAVKHLNIIFSKTLVNKTSDNNLVLLQLQQILMLKNQRFLFTLKQFNDHQSISDQISFVSSMIYD